MAKNRDAAPADGSHEGRPSVERFAIVWIDSESATILRWRGRVVAEKVVSDVPPHTGSTAHVRHDPSVRHGGSGRGQDDFERRRNEHLRAFLHAVADRLGEDDPIEILGSGTIGGRLASFIRQRTSRPQSPPSIVAVHSMPLTPRQLAARLRQRLGLGSRRVTVGAYRWSGDLPRNRCGGITGPRRVLEKALRPEAPDTRKSEALEPRSGRR